MINPKKPGLYLRKSGQTWQVVVNVPMNLRRQIGRVKLIRSLGRVTLKQAEIEKWPVWRSMQEVIAEADRAVRTKHKAETIGRVRIAEVSCYDGLIQALKKRRASLGMSQIDVDDAAGLQGGYTGKIEAGVKNLGPMSFDKLLSAYQIRIVIEGKASNPITKAIKSGRKTKLYEPLVSKTGGGLTWVVDE